MLVLEVIPRYKGVIYIGFSGFGTTGHVQYRGIPVQRGFTVLDCILRKRPINRT